MHSMRMHHDDIKEFHDSANLCVLLDTFKRRTNLAPCSFIRSKQKYLMNLLVHVEKMKIQKITLTKMDIFMKKKFSDFCGFVTLFDFYVISHSAQEKLPFLELLNKFPFFFLFFLLVYKWCQPRILRKWFPVTFIVVIISSDQLNRSIQLIYSIKTIYPAAPRCQSRHHHVAKCRNFTENFLGS